LILFLLIIFVTIKYTSYFKGKSNHIKLKIPKEYKGFSAFNPSIFYDDKNKEYNVLIRVSNACPVKIYNLVDTFILKNKIHSYVLHQKMNNNLSEVLESKIINVDYPILPISKNNNKQIQKSFGLEDARLIRFKDKWYMYGSFYSPTTLTMNVMLIRLSDDLSIIEKYYLFESKTTQKNWISLIHNNTLYFVKYLYPFELLQFDENNGIVVDSYKSKDNSSEIFKNLRGGTQSIPIDYKNWKGYLCVTHKRIHPLNYKHQFVLLSSEYPFEPIWKSTDFVIDDSQRSGIEFACGLSNYFDENDKNDNNKSVIVTFGRFDYYSNYKIYKLSEIFNL